MDTCYYDRKSMVLMSVAIDTEVYCNVCQWANTTFVFPVGVLNLGALSTDLMNMNINLMNILNSTSAKIVVSTSIKIQFTSN